MRTGALVRTKRVRPCAPNRNTCSKHAALSTQTLIGASGCEDEKLHERVRRPLVDRIPPLVALFEERMRELGEQPRDNLGYAWNLLKNTGNQVRVQKR